MLAMFMSEFVASEGGGMKQEMHTMSCSGHGSTVTMQASGGILIVTIHWLDSRLLCHHRLQNIVNAISHCAGV